MLARPGRNARGKKFKNSCEEKSSARLSTPKKARPSSSTCVMPLALSEEGSGTRQARLLRGEARQWRHGDLRENEEKLTFLERNTVRPGTEVRYRAEAQEYETWVGGAAWKQEPLDALDAKMLEYLEALYFGGHAANKGDFVMAALRYFRSEISLPRCARAMKGYHRLAPGSSRAPLPWVAACAMLGSALSRGEVEFATMLVTQFMGYLRPSELAGLTVSQIIAPTTAAQVRGWAILLSPQEDKRGSKTNQYDESLIMDWDLPALWKRMRLQLKGKSGKDRVFSLSQASYSKAFALEAELSGVKVLGPHVYSVRHGGASEDALSGLRDLAAIQARGRWLVPQSVRRYEKHARLLKEIQRLPKPTLRYGMMIRKGLNKFLEQPASTPRAPAGAANKGKKLARSV